MISSTNYSNILHALQVMKYLGRRYLRPYFIGRFIEKLLLDFKNDLRTLWIL